MRRELSRSLAADRQALADTIPHAQHRMIADANHMSPITHPAQVNPLILQHDAVAALTAACGRFGSRRFVSISGASVRAL